MVTEQVRGKAKPDLCPAKQVGAAWLLWLGPAPLPVDTGLQGCPCSLQAFEASGASSEQKNSQMLLLNAKPRGA